MVRGFSSHSPGAERAYLAPTPAMAGVSAEYVNESLFVCFDHR